MGKFTMIIMFSILTITTNAQTYAIRISPYYCKNCKVGSDLAGKYERDRITITLNDQDSRYMFMNQYVRFCVIFYNNAKNDSVFVGYYDKTRQDSINFKADFGALKGYYKNAEKIDFKDLSPPNK